MFERTKDMARLLRHRRRLRQWENATREAATMDIARLRAFRTSANQIRHRINKALHVADERLTLPFVGSSAMQKPLDADWAYRPEIWRNRLAPPGMAAVENRSRLGDEATLFHDCAISELTLRQVRNTGEQDLAPFALRMDVFRFDGSYLSLVIDLPHDAAEGLTRRHLIGLDLTVETEKPIEIFARLNIRHGPNTAQIVRELPPGKGHGAPVEFDLAYSDINERRIEKIWFDLIFEEPEMNQIVLRDMTCMRHPRAEL